MCFYDNTWTRTEHELFLVLRITPNSRANVCAKGRMSLSAPVACYLPLLEGDVGVILTLLFGVGVSRRIFFFYC